MSVVEYVEIPEGLEKIFPIVKELRPHLEFAEFKRLVSLAHAADGYRIVAREVKGQVVAVMGFRILHDLVHGSHLYVDDLVVTKDERSGGHGAQLLRFAEGEARRLGLAGLRLCAGNENKEAHKFYVREGWEVRALAFKKKMSTH